MVRANIRQQLALAERHIRDGEQRIARLRELVAHEALRGVEASNPIDHLDHEERQQKIRRMDRGRLIAILAWFERAKIDQKAGYWAVPAA